MKRIIAIISTIPLIIFTSSCKEQNNYKNSKEIFNNFYYVRMDDGVIYRNNSMPSLLDFESMKTTIICNIPNCAHDSDCIIKALMDEDQLPIIYNDCAYYFENNASYKENSEKLELVLSSKLKKYNFADCKFSDVSTIKDHNINIDDGCYLVGSDYYFTTNTGNPVYDTVGNVTSYNSGGGGNLFSINLDNGKVTDYGEIFDYKKLKEEFPSAQKSLSMYLMGKLDNKLHIGINYMKEELTPEMMQNGNTPLWCGMTYTFDLDNHTIEKYNDEFSMCSMNDYHSYFTNDQNTLLTLQNVRTGEIYNGPDIVSWNAMSIFDDKVWHDDAKCFDIKTGKEVKVSSFDYGQVIAKYKDSYIFNATDKNGNTVFEKILSEEIDKLFE